MATIRLGGFKSSVIPYSVSTAAALAILACEIISV
jgi:hypothetical protein